MDGPAVAAPPAPDPDAAVWDEEDADGPACVLRAGGKTRDMFALQTALLPTVNDNGGGGGSGDNDGDGDGDGDERCGWQLASELKVLRWLRWLVQTVRMQAYDRSVGIGYVIYWLVTA